MQLSSWEGVGVAEDTADTVSTSSSVLRDEDVTCVTPCSSPGVSDDPSVVSVSDGGHGVVDLATSEAVCVIVDTAFVGLEGSSISFDVDNNWALLNGLLKSSDISWTDVAEAFGLEGRGDLFASAITSSVRV